MRDLSGFGCERIAYDLYESSEVKESGVSYVDLEQMWKRADVISLHMPLTDDNFHMIGQEAIAKMKDGVMIVNTARGGLIDTQALIAELNPEKSAGRPWMLWKMSLACIIMTTNLIY